MATPLSHEKPKKKRGKLFTCIYFSEMDPFYYALIQFRRREFESCSESCSVLLKKNPYDEAVWSLKTRALTEQVKVDDIEGDEEGIADEVLDDNAISSVPRPGTSIKSTLPTAEGGGVSQTFRPSTQSGRPMSGVLRPGTQGGRPGTMDAALKIPRTAATARPVTAVSGRYKRLGTATMIPGDDVNFINLSRLNVTKYADRPGIGKALFEYIYYRENDIRTAMDLAAQALKASKYEDCYWKVQLGKCYFRLGLLRDAEKMLKSALKTQEIVETFLLLSKIHLRMDQPMAAMEVYRAGLSKYPDEVSLLTGIARVHEAVGNIYASNTCYKAILNEDAINVEAIACVAMNHFYSDQPELGLRFYRRLVQMGLYNAELYNNLGLCCFYAQQYDMTLSCMERAISLAEGETLGDVWYNVGHIALGIGDSGLAYQCFRLSLTANYNHAESYNNLGVLEMRKGRLEQAKAFFQTASTLSSHLFEPNFNLASLAYKTGDLQTSYLVVQKALNAFPDHRDSSELLTQLKNHFSVL